MKPYGCMLQSLVYLFYVSVCYHSSNYTYASFVYMFPNEISCRSLKVHNIVWTLLKRFWHSLPATTIVDSVDPFLARNIVA